MSIGRWAGYSAGGALVAFGVGGLLTDAARTHPVGWALWFAGGVAVHDLLVVPLVLLAGAALARTRAGPAVRAALLICVLVGVTAVPVLLGFGRRADDPSVLPLPYGRNLLLILAVVWLSAGIAAGARGWRRSRRRRAGQVTRPGR